MDSCYIDASTDDDGALDRITASASAHSSLRRALRLDISFVLMSSGVLSLTVSRDASFSAIAHHATGLAQIEDLDRLSIPVRHELLGDDLIKLLVHQTLLGVQVFHQADRYQNGTKADHEIEDHGTKSPVTYLIS